MQQSNKQILETIKDYFMYVFKQSAEIDMDYPIQKLVWKNRRVVFPFMVDYMGLNNYPVLVSNKEFKEIDSPKLYRGVKDPEHMANMLCDFNYHHGTGINDGLYASNDINIATSYTNDNRVKTDQNLVLTFKLSPLAKICKMKDIKHVKRYLLSEIPESLEERKTMVKLAADIFADSPNAEDIKQRIEDFYDFASNLSSDIERDVFIYSFKDEDSKLAIYLGYDAMQVTQNNFVIFNREKIIVPKSEFDKFVSQSKNYNSDGTIKHFPGDRSDETDIEKAPQRY